jgi:endonuclease YncB( thermonuclease family)
LSRCYDGDTCTFLGLEESVRFARVDTPEMDAECEAEVNEAQQKVRKKLRSADHICVDIKEKGKYGRWSAEVYADGTNINDWMLANSAAVKYGKEPRGNSGDDNESAGTVPVGEVNCDDHVDCGGLKS